jgi:curved DNA-binding protein CbpA
MSQDSFDDYYEVLQVSPNAQPETVQRVYRLLAQLYHPDNKETGNKQLFEQVLQAYRVLSDPEKRAAYDIDHRGATGLKWKIFDQSNAVQGLEGEKRKRLGILSLLCTKRMNEPAQPTLTIVELEQLLGVPREHLEISLWYLRETGRIQRGDSGKYLLTVKGLEMLEEQSENEPASEFRMLKPPVNSPLPSSNNGNETKQ